MTRQLGLFIFLVLLGLPARAAAPESKLSAEELRPVRIIQQRATQVPLDLAFQDEAHRTVRLGEMLDERPVILVLGYYRCPMLCGVVVRGLINSLLDLRFDVGRDFDVIHVSIDPQESPGLAAETKRSYLRRYGRKGADKGWHFLTGSAGSTRALAEAVGFGYRYDPAIRQYAHAAGIVVLTPAGKVSSYLLGVDFPAKQLRLALVDASAGAIGSPVDQLLLMCYHYNPVSGRYGVAIVTLLRLGGGITVLLVAGGAGFLFWRERKGGQAA